MFIKHETNALISSILNDDGWRQGEYCMVNTITHAKIWTGNGVASIDFYPHIGAFNFFEKIAVHRAIKKRNIFNAFPKNKTS